MKYFILILALVFTPSVAVADLTTEQEAVFEKMIRKHTCSGGNLTPLMNILTPAEEVQLYNQLRNRILQRNDARRQAIDNNDAKYPGPAS